MAGDFNTPSASSVVSILTKNPQLIGEVITAVMKSETQRITPPRGGNIADISPIGSPQNRIWPIPIQFTETIEEPTAYAGGAANGTYLQAEITSLKNQVAELTDIIQRMTAQFTASNINPGGGA